MEWYWPALSALLKLGLAFGPSAVRDGEFNFVTDQQRREALDLAGVVACRTMLITTPVVLAITTIGKSEKLCAGHAVSLLPIVLTAVLLLVFGWLAFSIDARRFRGRVAPFLVAITLAVLEIGYTEAGSEKVAEKLCVNQSSVPAGTPTPASAASSR